MKWITSLLFVLTSCSSSPRKETTLKPLKSTIYINELSSTEVYAKYCLEGEAKKKINQEVTFSLIKPEKGTPIDKANKNTKKRYYQATNFLKSFFVFEKVKEFFPDSYCGEVSNGSLLTACQSKLYFKDTGEYFANNKPLKHYVGNLKSWDDLSLIRHAYTILLDMKTQENLYKIEDPEDPYKFLAACQSDGFMNFDSECIFSEETAIKDRERSWFNYAHRFTSLKIKPISAPYVFSVNITLDLGLFCESAKLIDQMVVK